MLNDSMSKKALLMMAAMAIVLAAGCSPARYNRQQYALTEAELTSTRPWLTEYFEHWQQEVDLTGEQWPGYSDLGVFPIGNGRVFAHEGTVYPLGTLTNVIGPTYQKGSFLAVAGLLGPGCLPDWQRAGICARRYCIPAGHTDERHRADLSEGQFPG